MTTGNAFSLFTQGRLLVKEDFSEKILGYMKTNNEELLKRLRTQGAWDEKMTLAAGGANKVTIGLKPTFNNRYAHDGDGHQLELQPDDSTADFANVNTQVYEVGLKYIEYPEDLRINASDGTVEYDHMIEGVGREAVPDFVDDNGDETITFQIDSLFEAGTAVSDQSGRTVRVFKVIPALGSTLSSVLIVEETVDWSGSQNSITVDGTLGQTIVSGVEADYTVQLVGMTVLRIEATNRPSEELETTCFIGEVTGNGGTPTAFDIGDQVII